VRVDLAYAPLLVAGADLARALGPGTLRAEAARVWPGGVAGREDEAPYTRAGVGIDRTFPWLGPGVGLTLLAQYAFDEAGGEGAGAGVERYRHLFRHGGLLRLRLEPGGSTRLDVEALLDLEHRDRCTKIELAWSPETGFGVVAGLLLVDGSAAGPLGRFRENDQVRLLMRYAWSLGG
jgi:hypothetical protein